MLTAIQVFCATVRRVQQKVRVMTSLPVLTEAERAELFDMCIDRKNFVAVGRGGPWGREDARQWTLFEKRAVCAHTATVNRINITYICVVPPRTAVFVNCYVAGGTAEAPLPTVVVSSIASNQIDVECSDVRAHIGTCFEHIFRLIMLSAPGAQSIRLVDANGTNLMGMFAQWSMNMHRWLQHGDVFRRVEPSLSPEFSLGQ